MALWSVLREDTLLLHCLSPPKYINGTQQICRGWGIQLHISFCPSIYTKIYKSINVRVNKGVGVDVVVLN